MGRRYAVAFKEQPVRLVREGHRSVASVARELGVPENPRHDWVLAWTNIRSNRLSDRGSYARRSKPRVSWSAGSAIWKRRTRS
ncbi:MAG: transposase [Firmicutes bacterium]|nr:transposase [Bacillota bacterium]